jgi:uncharacterized protein DUF6496
MRGSGAKKRGGDKVRQVMGEYKRGTLHSGSKRGPLVQSRKQAIAIAMKQSGQSRDGGSRRALRAKRGRRGYG